MSLSKKIKQRDLYIFKSFSFSLLARIIGLIFTILVTPTILSYLGNEQYAIWSIVISFSGFLAFSDFGLSAGLLNFILKNKNDKIKVKKGIVSTFWFLVIASCVLMLTLSSLSLLINWNNVFNTSNDSVDVQSLIPLIIVLFLFNIPFSIIQKIQFGYLHNHIYHIWEVIQKSTLIITIFAGISFELSLNALLIIYYSIFIIINVLNLIIYRYKNDVFNIVKDTNKNKLDKNIFNSIFKTGVLFLLMNLTYTFGRSTDKVIIGYFGELTEVTNYDILLKPFEIFMVFIMMFTSTLWSAFGDAIYKKDFKWIKNVIRKSLYIILFLSLGITFTMSLYGNFVLELWLGNEYNFEMKYFISLGIWIFILALSNIFSAFLNASNKLVFQIYTFASYAILSIILKPIFITYFSLLEFIYINTICYSLAILIPSVYFIKNKGYENN